ncbi:unnamed protein product [Caretta caretta]
MGLAAGAVLLTLEAVARAQVASVAICMDLEGVCLVEAVAEAIDTFARGCPAAPLSSVFMVAADGALVATFHGACAKRWPPGESRQELLGNVLRAQEKVSTQVVSGSLASQKTDAVVLPVVLETDGLEWCPQEVQALAERALGAAGHSGKLQPGKVRTVLGTALPDLHCKVLYLVQLDGEALQQQRAPEVMHQMVRCCLCSMYGTFLESVSFPLLGASQTLPAMLEEISCFLEHQPNIWMKLVQIVHPLGLPAPRLVAEDPSTRAGKLSVILVTPCRFLRSRACGRAPPGRAAVVARWVIIKDMVEKELPDPHVRMELRQGTPAIITFQGPRRQVAEAESRCQQLLRAFQVLSETGVQLLRLMDWEHLQVTVQLHPNPQVLSLGLRGLLHHLQLASRAIKADLESLGRALQAPNAPRKPQKVQAGAPEGLELRVVGRGPDVGQVKAAVAGFMAQFHDESICNVELVAVGTQALRELSQASLYHLPVSLQRLPGNVLRVRGTWEDVAKAVAAVHARIQTAQRQRVEAEVLYRLVKWQHLAPAGWHPFNVATNQQLETAYAEIEWDGQRSNRCLAPHWEPMGKSLVRLVELAEGSEEYREMAEGFKRMAPGYCILHLLAMPTVPALPPQIQRVQNRVLWVSYCWQHHWMEEKNQPGELNKHLLYHGTQPENRHSIQEIGLRITCHKGQGLYFAAEAARLADYAKPDAHGHRFMFQVRVLTGQFTQGKEDMVLPPEKPDGGGRYDSVVNMVSRPSIFVTFFDDLTYPEYLITFRGTRLPLN